MPREIAKVIPKAAGAAPKLRSVYFEILFSNGGCFPMIRHPFHTIGIPRTMVSNYRFDGLAVARNYVVSAVSKRYNFSQPSIILSLKDSLTNADFEAEER